jgi:hypothetical protein
MYTTPCGPSIETCSGTVPPCGVRPTLPTEQHHRIQQAVMALGSFIGECDMVLNQLNSAKNTEMLDASTSNHSLFGSIVTNMSYRENMNVANRVDSLRNSAININHMLTGLQHPFNAGTASVLPPCSLLDTNLNGQMIRQSESNEHSFFWNFFTDNAYSSMASGNTIQAIQMTAERINAIRYQAASIQSMLSSMSMRPY